MRQLTDDEKMDLYKKVTDATAHIITAIITVQNSDLMARQLDISRELLGILGIEAPYDATEIMNGLDTDARQKWVESLEQSHAHTDYNVYICDKCGSQGSWGQREVEGSFKKWTVSHYKGECSYEMEHE